jgi:hypothetical protein
MGNRITEKYFDFVTSDNKIDKTVKEILSKENFKAEKEIFRGRIYDKDKVGSVIILGKYKNKPAILKAQFLKPEIEEYEIIRKFNKQNKSKIIRLPLVYKNIKWNKSKGYGYAISEYIDAPFIYKPPFASKNEIKKFINFYQEYSSKCLNKPLFKKCVTEESSLTLTLQRISHWIKISESKNIVKKEDIKRLEKYFFLAAKYLPLLKVKFLHSHLAYSDILEISKNEYVLLSNLFWAYRPEYYDTTFHLWAALKSIKNKKISTKKVINYLETWRREYKKIPAIKKDKDFDRKFRMLMLERCVGVLLVDVDNKNKYIKNLFRNLFDYYSKKFYA